jgi:hypothetical protein
MTEERRSLGMPCTIGDFLTNVLFLPAIWACFYFSFNDGVTMQKYPILVVMTYGLTFTHTTCILMIKHTSHSHFSPFNTLVVFNFIALITNIVLKAAK